MKTDKLSASIPDREPYLKAVVNVLKVGKKQKKWENLASWKPLKKREGKRIRNHWNELTDPDPYQNVTVRIRNAAFYNW